MILWCVNDYQAKLSFFDQIMFHDIVLLLYIYIMYVQSGRVYKLMTIIIVLVPVIKDVKIVQLNVFTGFILFEEFLTVEHCNEFSLSFKKRKTCIYALLAHKFQRNQIIFMRCLNTCLYIKQEKTFSFY